MYDENSVKALLAQYVGLHRPPVKGKPFIKNETGIMMASDEKRRLQSHIMLLLHHERLQNFFSVLAKALSSSTIQFVISDVTEN